MHTGSKCWFISLQPRLRTQYFFCFDIWRKSLKRNNIYPRWRFEDHNTGRITWTTIWILQERHQETDFMLAALYRYIWWLYWCMNSESWCKLKCFFYWNKACSFIFSDFWDIWMETFFDKLFDTFLILLGFIILLKNFELMTLLYETSHQTLIYADATNFLHKRAHWLLTRFNYFTNSFSLRDEIRFHLKKKKNTYQISTECCKWSWKTNGKIVYVFSISLF